MKNLFKILLNIIIYIIFIGGVSAIIAGIINVGDHASKEYGVSTIILIIIIGSALVSILYGLFTAK